CSARKCGTITIWKACGRSGAADRRAMRLWILAVGHMRGTPEGQLCDQFVDRAYKLGRGLGFTGVTLEEVAVSRQREMAARMKDEAERLASRLPEGAH